MTKKRDPFSIFEVFCDECGEEIFAVEVTYVRDLLFRAGGDLFYTCAVCDHTTRFLTLNEEGLPVWRGDLTA